MRSRSRGFHSAAAIQTWGMITLCAWACLSGGGCSETSSARCVQTTSVASPDSAEIGFSARDVLDEVEGSWTCDVTFADSADPAVDVSVPPGVTVATLTLDCGASEIEVVREERQGGGDERLACAESHYRTTCAVTLTTEDGVFDEQLPTIVQLREEGLTSKQQLEQAFRGSYEFGFTEDWAREVTTFRLELRRSPRTATGVLTHVGEADSASAGMVFEAAQLACSPSDG